MPRLVAFRFLLAAAGQLPRASPTAAVSSSSMSAAMACIPAVRPPAGTLVANSGTSSLEAAASFLAKDCLCEDLLLGLSTVCSAGSAIFFVHVNEREGAAAMSSSGRTPSTMPLIKIVTLAGTCGTIFGFAAGFRVAEQIYATEREKAILYKRFKLLTSLAVGVAAVTVIATTLASSSRI